MDTIDRLRTHARENGKPISDRLNGIPIRVHPDGRVERLEEIEAFEVDADNILRRKA